MYNTTANFGNTVFAESELVFAGFAGNKPLTENELVFAGFAGNKPLTYISKFGLTLICTLFRT